MSTIKTVSWVLLTFLGMSLAAPAVLAATPTARVLVAQNPAASNLNLTNIFSKNVPTSVLLKDLNTEWQVMNVSTSVESISGILKLFTLGGYGQRPAPEPLYFTKGHTLLIGAETYVVAYSLQELPDIITPNTTLNLSLLNVKTLGNPLNIHTFNVVNETKVLDTYATALRLNKKAYESYIKRQDGSTTAVPTAVPSAPTEYKPASKKPRRR
jgi:hypothetical protein